MTNRHAKTINKLLFSYMIQQIHKQSLVNFGTYLNQGGKVDQGCQVCDKSTHHTQKIYIKNHPLQAFSKLKH